MTDLFAETIDFLDAQLASEHLAFNEIGPCRRADGTEADSFTSAFFLPPRQTVSGVKAAVAAISTLRRPLQVPFSVETPVNYLRPRSDEMTDATFMAEVVEGADCGIVLDLHNLWANERNGRQPVIDYVDELPLDRVWEVHLAGGFERRGFWLDAHSGDIPPEVIAIADEVLPRLPALRAVVYEVMPEFVDAAGTGLLRRDLEKVHRLVDGARAARRRQSATGRSAPRIARATDSPANSMVEDKNDSPHLWEAALGGLAIGRPADGDLSEELARDPAIDLLTELVGAGRKGRIASALMITVELLLARHGATGTSAVLDAYAMATDPALWGSREAEQFAVWLTDRQPDDPELITAMRLDLAASRAAVTGQTETVHVLCDPTELIAAVRSGDAVRPTLGAFTVVIAP